LKIVKKKETKQHLLYKNPHQKKVFKKISHVNILVRKDMDVNEHERLSNITLKHKLK
jgi:hypothetical protein